jgi:glycosyltransferase involved in cell wall biosynthesis
MQLVPLHSGVVIRSEVRLTLAEARNLAASKAKGEYLLFMDDDNAAKPWEVSTLVTAALVG